MNTALFKIWLIKNGNSSKIASDTLCRLKRIDQSLIESHISSSVDSEFNKDNCEQLLKCFSKNGKNKVMDEYKLSLLPIGEIYMNTYKLSLTKYITFKKECSDG